MAQFPVSMKRRVFGLFEHKSVEGRLANGAPRRNRTADPIITNDVLYQLSYRGTARVLGERPNPRKRPSGETQR
jgi:hypothetical protein